MIALKELLLQAIGRVSLIADLVDLPFYFRDRRLRLARVRDRHDRTGLVAPGAEPEVWYDDGDVLFVGYDSLSHSLWRAQELSLFRRYKNTLREPVLDFGCGDGSFSAILFDKIEYGVDNDADVLVYATARGIFRETVCTHDSNIPLPDGCAGSVFSNSVLEHVRDLDHALSELYRILHRGGIFMFSVPTKQFERDLTRYFGKRASRRVNERYFHHNLLEAGEWVNIVARHGFTISTVIPFQPTYFTFVYRTLRLLRKRGLGFFWPGICHFAWKKYKGEIVGMVRNSINETKNGANIFVVATKA